jgi:arsenate reductase
MESIYPDRLSTLGHPQRLAVFRLLMRRYPHHVPATELARALGLKPNTLSTYVNALMQAGLIHQKRMGTSRLYAIDMDAARDIIDYLMHDCCRGRPEICAPLAGTAPIVNQPEAAPPYNVLFLCTGNSARSIFAESILRAIGGDRFVAYSAGTAPRAAPNRYALDVLKQKGFDASIVRSKAIVEFRAADAPTFDFVFTVCDHAANEDSPKWPGQPISAHWGMPDPVQVNGSDTAKARAFQHSFDTLYSRISQFTALPFATLGRASLQRAFDTIGQSPNEGPLS